jgi:hypothetical protein
LCFVSTSAVDIQVKPKKKASHFCNFYLVILQSYQIKIEFCANENKQNTIEFCPLALAKKAGSTANVIYESKSGNFWYNEDGDRALAGALLFANAKGISDTYWISAGVM